MTLLELEQHIKQCISNNSKRSKYPTTINPNEGYIQVSTPEYDTLVYFSLYPLHSMYIEYKDIELDINYYEHQYNSDEDKFAFELCNPTEIVELTNFAIKIFNIIDDKFKISI